MHRSTQTDPLRGGSIAREVSGTLAADKRRDGLRVGVFGTFYPRFQLVGNVTSGLVITLSELPEVVDVRVYCPEGSSMPTGVNPAKVRLVQTWRHDSPPSLITSLFRIARDSRKLDLIIFNMYITSFGKSFLANGTGMALPTLLARLTDRPVVAYMHNFVETQDARKLGYNPSFLSLWCARQLESALVKSATVVVPLRSQRDVIETAFSSKIHDVFLPYIDALVSLRAVTQRDLQLGYERTRERGGRVLLLGTWGPQKDLVGALDALHILVETKEVATVTVAGEINQHFPREWQSLERAMSFRNRDAFVRIPFFREEDVLPLLARNDLLLLPYNATGGVSGVLNCAALSGIPVVAYDLPQLHQQAELMGYEVAFVRQGNAVEFTEAIRKGLARARPRVTLREMDAKVTSLREQVRTLIGLLSPNASAA